MKTIIFWIKRDTDDKWRIDSSYGSNVRNISGLGYVEESTETKIRKRIKDYFKKLNQDVTIRLK